MNLFRLSTGKLDKQYLRTCAVFKLMKQGNITSKARALELLEQRHGKRSTIKHTLGQWIDANPSWNIGK